MNLWCPLEMRLSQNPRKHGNGFVFIFSRYYSFLNSNHCVSLWTATYQCITDNCFILKNVGLGTKSVIILCEQSLTIFKGILDITIAVTAHKWWVLSQFTISHSVFFKAVTFQLRWISLYFAWVFPVLHEFSPCYFYIKTNS